MTDYTITSAKARVISAEIDAAVAEILERHGLQKAKISTTYGDSYTCKIQACAVTLNEAGVNLTSPEAQSWIVNARSILAEAYDYTLEEPKMTKEEITALLGKEFTNGSAKYTFIGCNARARKMPLHAKSLKDGKTYTFPVSAIKRILAA